MASARFITPALARSAIQKWAVATRLKARVITRFRCFCGCLSWEGKPPDIAGYLATLPEPTYGRQLQDFATVGHAAEYTLNISYTETEVMLADGTTVSLHAPTYTAANLAYGPLHTETYVFPPRGPRPCWGLAC